MTRMIAGIFVKEGCVVQTIGFERFYFLGELACVLRNIIELKPDEICILSIDGKLDHVDFGIREFTKLNLPLIVGGGVSKINLAAVPAERFLINSAYFEGDNNTINTIINKSGKQSIICLLPFKYRENVLQVWNSESNELEPMCEKKIFDIYDTYSEVIFLDMDNQGEHSGFNFDLIRDFKSINRKQTIIAGGINSETIKKAKELKLAGIMIDNQPLYYNKEIYLR